MKNPPVAGRRKEEAMPDVAAKRSVVQQNPLRITILRLDGRTISPADTLVFPGDEELRGRWAVEWAKYTHTRDKSELTDFSLRWLGYDAVNAKAAH